MAKKTPPPASKSGEKAGNSVALSQLVEKVLEPAVARRAGMTLDLIRAWPELAGTEFAGSTCPVKIEWPRRIGEDDPFRPATLVVACESGAALFLQHRQAEILQQVNLYFGFEAIARLRIMQRPVSQTEAEPASPKRQLTSREKKRLTELVKRIEDPDLKATILKLGRGLILANEPFISD